jgi:tetratricopeptide (TPR) repeat protein
MKALKVLPIALLLTASFALAQTNTNQQPASTAPAAQQQSKPGNFTIGSAPAPAPKQQPQAKSKPEYDAYVAMMALKDPSAMEKAADDFITKFPDSELKAAAYERVMLMYQQAGNDDKTIEMGQKSLTFNPDTPGVLVALSDTLVRGTHDTDLDKDQRLEQATRYAKHALETVGDYPAPPNMPPEQVMSVKNDLRSAAYASIGAAAYTNKKYADAEVNFRQAVDVIKDNPDPTTMLRLALTLDKESKYADALDQINKILAMPNLDPRVSSYAQQEKTRLTQLAPAAKPASAPAAPTTAPSTPK